MRQLLFLFLLIICKTNSFGQINVIEFPKSQQFFAREDNNYGLVQINGFAKQKSGEILILNIYANTKLIKTESDTIKSENHIFQFKVPIKASLIEFTFKLFSKSQKSQAQTLIIEADKILCGDAIALYGQSNMAAINGYEEFGSDPINKFISTYFVNGFNEMVWGKANLPYAGVGTIGSNLAKNLIDAYRIPICIINGAKEGASIELLAKQNPYDKYDVNYPYGLFLSKLKNSGLLDKIKVLGFSQGEADAGLWYQSANDYPKNFDVFYNQIKSDFKSLKKIYLFQTNILNGTYNERAGFLRDFQRQAQTLYPDISTISSVGLEPFDGIHFGAKAYEAKASKMFDLLARDFYGSQNLDNINSPNIQSAYYTANRDSIILEFDPGQSIIYPQDLVYYSYSRRLIDHISLTSDSTNINFNHRNKPVVSGIAFGNKVILKLREPSNFKFINYLPSTFSDEFSYYYNGVHLKNKKGLNALSFYLFPIASSAPKKENKIILPKEFNVNAISKSEIRLNWSANPNLNVSYEVEASTDGKDFKPIYSLVSTQCSVSNLNSNQNYFFRMRVCLSGECSGYSDLKKTRTFLNDSHNCNDLAISSALFDNVVENKNLKKMTKAEIIKSKSLFNSNIFESFDVYNGSNTIQKSRNIEFKSSSDLCF